MLPAIPRSFIVVLSVAAAVTAISGQSQQPPTFSTANRTVAVYATVTNEAGRLVPDLGREHFTVTDNGKPQELTLNGAALAPHFGKRARKGKALESKIKPSGLSTVQ